ncbi:MAG: feruloyl-CoA synthase [Rubrivivax sp.]
MTHEPSYRRIRVGGCLHAEIETLPDGSTLLRSTEALQPYPERLTDRLVHWAQAAPQRTFAARRGPDGAWVRIGYADMLARARAVGQALLARGVGPERPLAILSGNDLEHLTLALGAMLAGLPHVPVSPAYSLVSRDFAKLRHVLEKTTPAVVYAATAAHAEAIAATVGADTGVVLGAGTLRDRHSEPFDALLHTVPGPAQAAAEAAAGPDTVVKILFTSGSTQLPKGVVTTNRMICANQQMIRQCLAFLADEPPVLVDWLPWNHVFGGTHNVGIALYNGGTLYIDDGRPTPDGIAQTLHNLREISPTVYFNVPRGLEEIAHAMDHDPALRDSLFRRCQAIMFAGAGLSQAVWDRLHVHAEQAVGERVRLITGLGMTEASPTCTFAVGTDVASGHLGLPVPGVQARLVRDDGTGGKTEIRFRGPNLMPGYWREPQRTRDAFDDDSWYRTGDAVRWLDPADPQRGLCFDGRTAEDFKLSTGTFVSVGPLRARVVAAGAPLVQDAVITGLNRNEVGALIVPRMDEARRMAGAGVAPGAPWAEVLQAVEVRRHFQRLADRLWQEATGSANRVAFLHVLDEPLSIDAGEVTDKGSVNQRAVLARRAALVDALHEGQAARVTPYQA